MTACNHKQRSYKPLRIGMIGVDNPRAVTFARLLHDVSHPFYIPGARITAAWPGAASADFALSYDRQERFVRQLRDELGVPIADSLDEVAEQCDAWMLEAVDGRTRAELFGQMAAYGKPIFVDKPFALHVTEAEEMMRQAEAFGTKVMSCSALRYAEALTSSLQDGDQADLQGADFYGPMTIEPTQAGYFWYGIHTAEMLVSALGPEVFMVRSLRTPDHDVVVAVWRDGRIGTMRGNRTGNDSFGGTLHRGSSSQPLEVREQDKPYLASLLEEIVQYFRSGQPPIEPRQTLAVIRLLEAANESLAQDRSIYL